MGRKVSKYVKIDPTCFKQVQTDLKISKHVQNGRKWPLTVQIVQNFPNWRENCGNGQKLSRMVNSLSKTVKNGPILSFLV